MHDSVAADGLVMRWIYRLRDLSPAYFGLVMATGIVSLAAFMMGHRLVAISLFYLNIVQYFVLLALYVLRLWRFPGRFFGDMFTHAVGPGYFTMVAGTGILANQFLILGENVAIGAAFWGFAVLLWLCLTYTIFTALTIKRDKPTLDKGINGGWLLAVVATQAISVASALLAARIGQPYRLEINLLALSMWLFGGMLYIWLMSLIFYRYAFFRFSPDDLSPPYWINMGAMAISTLAGARLALAAGSLPVLEQFLPFLKGFSVFYWASGSWWIPLLLVLGVWRHLLRRFPLRYDPLYWSAVFPLGMYAAATHDLSRALNISFLGWLPPIFLSTAWLAWSLALVGLLLAGVRLSGKR